MIAQATKPQFLALTAIRDIYVGKQVWACAAF
jgi:hypothetical protein